MSDITRAFKAACQLRDNVKERRRLEHRLGILAERDEFAEHVIKVRLEEKKAAEDAEVRRQKKQQLLAIIAEKESENLKGKGIDELRELLESL